VVLVLRFWPNSIQQEEDCAGTCFTTHRRHWGIFSFRTKAAVVELSDMVVVVVIVVVVIVIVMVVVVVVVVVVWR